MPLFKNKKETQKQQPTEIKKAKGRRAKTAQQSIPYDEVYPNGMIKVGPGLFSKSYYFGDMNFATEKEDKQEEILKSYSKLLSKYAPNVTAQFTIFNHKTSADKIKEKFFLKPRNGSGLGRAEDEVEREKRQQEYRDEYNAILDNRIKEGRKAQIQGLKMLLEAQKFSEGSTATDVAFNIVPVLNACGRLKDDGAKMGVVALIDGGREKREKVNELLELNDLRKKLVEEAVSRLDLYAMAVSKDRSIFVVDNQIPLGIVGIVAGKISEYTGKPAFVLAKDETTGFYKGSARSKSNDYSLAGLMEAHAELFVGFGGHLKAAGLTMKEKNIMVFKNAIEKELPDVIFDDAIPYDIEILEADFPMVAAQILSLEPFGEGNPAPVIRLQMTVDNYSIIGKNKDTLKFTGFGYEAIMFHAKEQISMLPKHVSVIDLIGKVGVNVFRGNITTQINITDFVVLR